MPSLKRLNAAGEWEYVDLIGEDFPAHKEDNTPHREAMSVDRGTKNADDIYATIEFKRADGTLYKTSTLNGTSPNFTSRTVDFYNTDGTTVIQTVEYDLTYVDDEIVSEVIVSA